MRQPLRLRHRLPNSLSGNRLFLTRVGLRRRWLTVSRYNFVSIFGLQPFCGKRYQLFDL